MNEEMGFPSPNSTPSFERHMEALKKFAIAASAVGVAADDAADALFGVKRISEALRVKAAKNNFYTLEIIMEELDVKNDGIEKENTYITVAKAINQAISDITDEGESLSYTINDFVPVSKMTDDKGWRSTKLLPGSVLVLSTVKVGARSLLFGFDCTDSNLETFYCECPLKVAEEKIPNFRDELMLAINAEKPIGELLHGVELPNAKPKKEKPLEVEIKITPPVEKSPLFGSW